MARVFKNMRSRMIEDGLIKTGIAPPVHQPQPFSVGVFSGELRWFPRVCADSCKRLRTSLVCHPTHLSAYSPLSGPFFSPASLPIKRPKSASTTNSPVTDQQVTSGWIAALATWTDRQKRPHRRNLDQHALRLASFSPLPPAGTEARLFPVRGLDLPTGAIGHRQVQTPGRRRVRQHSDW